MYSSWISQNRISGIPKTAVTCIVNRSKYLGQGPVIWQTFIPSHMHINPCRTSCDQGTVGIRNWRAGTGSYWSLLERCKWEESKLVLCSWELSCQCPCLSMPGAIRHCNDRNQNNKIISYSSNLHLIWFKMCLAQGFQVLHQSEKANCFGIHEVWLPTLLTAQIVLSNLHKL